MADQLADGMAWLTNMLATHESRHVTYRRGIFFVTLDATRGQETFETVNLAGAVQHYQARDFIFPASQLILGSMTEKPTRGDEIELVVGSETQIFQVLPPPGMDDCWRYSDPAETRIRVHTKRTS